MKKLFTIVTILITGILLTACGGTSRREIDQNLVGNWGFDFEETGRWHWSWVYIFNEDGTGKRDGGIDGVADFEWYVVGNELRIDCSINMFPVDIWTYRIENHVLVIENTGSPVIQNLVRRMTAFEIGTQALEVTNQYLSGNLDTADAVSQLDDLLEDFADILNILLDQSDESEKTWEIAWEVNMIAHLIHSESDRTRVESYRDALVESLEVE